MYLQLHKHFSWAPLLCKNRTSVGLIGFSAQSYIGFPSKTYMHKWLWLELVLPCVLPKTLECTLQLVSNTRCAIVFFIFLKFENNLDLKTTHTQASM